MGLLYFVALAYALSRGGVSLDAILALGAGAGSAGGTALAGADAESAPALVTWSFAVLAVVAGLGALGLALWVSLGARLARPDDDDEGPAASPLEAAVDDSVEDLRAEPDPRRAIVRCYARFERAAAASGVERKPWSTPMEFMREALRRLPLPRTAVPTLTGLFELARFSHHPARAERAGPCPRGPRRDQDGDAGDRGRCRSTLGGLAAGSWAGPSSWPSWPSRPCPRIWHSPRRGGPWPCAWRARRR